VPFVDHIAIGVTDLAASQRFYDAVLAPLGARRRFRDAAQAIYGSATPNGSFGLSRPGGPTPPQAGAHVCFAAGSRDEVDLFWRAGLAAGGTDNGAPGYRPQYSPDYYGAFLIDPEGNHMGAVARLPPEATATPRARLVDHVSIGTADRAEAARFYDTLLAPLDGRRLYTGADFVMYGTERANSTFVLATPDPAAGRPLPQPGFQAWFSANGTEAAFRFHAAGLNAGATDAGRPAPRPELGPDCWGACLTDPWGNALGVVARGGVG
jgi:catechol 2,3-dioxygenase-like lactoylglutathione lyase family enzyme